MSCGTIFVFVSGVEAWKYIKKYDLLDMDAEMSKSMKDDEARMIRRTCSPERLACRLDQWMREGKFERRNGSWA